MIQIQRKGFFLTSIAVLLVSVSLFPAAGFAQEDKPEAATQEPIQVVEATAAELQKQLAGKQKYYAKRTAELYAVIGEILLPAFDVEYSGKLVLGKKHWTAATPEQRERFINVFYDFLVKTYAKAVLEFDQDKLLISPDVSYSKKGDKALVRTELIVDGGDNVQVNYAVRNRKKGWKIYDVRVEGVSYIQNYRSQFDAEISAQGIESVIQRLEREIQQQMAAETAADQA